MSDCVESRDRWVLVTEIELEMEKVSCSPSTACEVDRLHNLSLCVCLTDGFSRNAGASFFPGLRTVADDAGRAEKNKNKKEKREISKWARRVLLLISSAIKLCAEEVLSS